MTGYDLWINTNHNKIIIFHNQSQPAVAYHEKYDYVKDSGIWFATTFYTQYMILQKRVLLSIHL